MTAGTTRTTAATIANSGGVRNNSSNSADSGIENNSSNIADSGTEGNINNGTNSAAMRATAEQAALKWICHRRCSGKVKRYGWQRWHWRHWQRDRRGWWRRGCPGFGGAGGGVGGSGGSGGQGKRRCWRIGRTGRYPRCRWRWWSSRHGWTAGSFRHRAAARTVGATGATEPPAKSVQPEAPAPQARPVPTGTAGTAGKTGANGTAGTAGKTGANGTMATTAPREATAPTAVLAASARLVVNQPVCNRSEPRFSGTRIAPAESWVSAISERYCRYCRPTRFGHSAPRGTGAPLPPSHRSSRSG